MNCPKCQNEMVEARATHHGDTYQYCRTCKKELKELEASLPEINIKLPTEPTFYLAADSNPYTKCVFSFHVFVPGCDICNCMGLERKNGNWQMRVAELPPGSIL